MKNELDNNSWRSEVEDNMYYKEVSYEDVSVGTEVFQAKLTTLFKGDEEHNNIDFYYLVPSEFLRGSHKRADINFIDKLTIKDLKKTNGQKFIASIRGEERVQANFKTNSYSHILQRTINIVISSYMGVFSVLYGKDYELVEAQDKMTGRKRNHLSSQKDSPLGVEPKKDMDTDFYSDNFNGMF